LLSRRVYDLRDGVRLASEFLVRYPGDHTVRMDRALCLRALGEDAKALVDFRTVGYEVHDSRALMFAGLLALRSGDRPRARRDLLAAIRYDPHFLAARRALTRLGSS
jgi:Flp pilus assembly protein TadD